MTAMGLRGVVLFMGTLSFFCGSVEAADKPQSAPAASVVPESDTEKVIRYTRELEVDPGAADADDRRRWLLDWVVNTPDYTVMVCNVMGISDASQGEVPNAALLTVQMMFGNAAYQIAHDSKKDGLASQVAGVESALTVYGALLAKDPKARIPKLDVLARRRAAGELPRHLQQVMVEACGGDQMLAGARSDEPPLFLGDHLRTTSVVMPVRIADWQAVDEHRYDEVQLGASIRFQRGKQRDGWMDVYFYPVGLLSTEQEAAFVAQERQQLVQALKPADITPLETFQVERPADGGASSSKDADDRMITAYAADLSFTKDGATFNSGIVVAVHHMYAIKFRFSADAEQLPRARLREELKGFAENMLSQVSIQNTGMCGVVPPLQVLARGTGAPSGETRAIARLEDGTAVAWLMPRKIVLRDDEAMPAAQQLIEYTQQQARLSGCAADGSLLPTVPDGMRELRFEYRKSP